MPDDQPGDFFDYLGAVPISNARTLGLGAFVAGLSLLLIGQPRTAAGEPALWGRVVLVVSLTIGAGLGIAATLLMLANF